MLNQVLILDILQPLESRRMLSASVAGGVLTIEGTSSNDLIEVSLTSAGVRVAENGTSALFPLGSITSIAANGNFGNDKILIYANLPCVLHGNDGNDSLFGGGADDVLWGDGHQDWLDGGLGDDELWGGSGRDFAGYSLRTSAVIVTIDSFADDGAAGEHDNVHIDVENIFGGQGNDYLSGWASRNQLIGYAGNDTLLGLGGDDYLLGDSGDDSMLGFEGHDRLDGGIGADRFSGGLGIDFADFSWRSENLIISLDGLANDGKRTEGDNVLGDVENVWGGSGHDAIIGTEQAHELCGLGGYDRLEARAGNDSLRGGDGNDWIYGEDGDDRIDGGLGADEFVGGSGRDCADYGLRHESINMSPDNSANDGARTETTAELDNIRSDIEDFRGGSDKDFIFAQFGSTRNQVWGNGGNDWINTYGGDDSIYGGAGNDFLFSGDGNDTAWGELGDDLISDGATDRAADLYVGGAGSDTISYGQRQEKLFISLDETANDGAAGENDQLLSFENVIGGWKDDVIVGNNQHNRLEGMKGNDTINGLGGDDAIFGGDGSDMLFGGPGFDHLDGNSGSDTADADADDSLASIETLL